MRNSKFYIFSIAIYCMWIFSIYQSFIKMFNSSYIGAAGLILASLVFYLLLGLIMFKKCYKNIEPCKFLRRFHVIVTLFFLSWFLFTENFIFNEDSGYLTGLISGLFVVFLRPTKLAYYILKWRKVDFESL